MVLRLFFYSGIFFLYFSRFWNWLCLHFLHLSFDYYFDRLFFRRRNFFFVFTFLIKIWVLHVISLRICCLLDKYSDFWTWLFLLFFRLFLLSIFLFHLLSLLHDRIWSRFWFWLRFRLWLWAIVYQLLTTNLVVFFFNLQFLLFCQAFPLFDNLLNKLIVFELWKFKLISFILSSRKLSIYFCEFVRFFTLFWLLLVAICCLCWLRCWLACRLCLLFTHLIYHRRQQSDKNMLMPPENLFVPLFQKQKFGVCNK